MLENEAKVYAERAGELAQQEEAARAEEARLTAMLQAVAPALRPQLPPPLAAATATAPQARPSAEERSVVVSGGDGHGGPPADPPPSRAPPGADSQPAAAAAPLPPSAPVGPPHAMPPPTVPAPAPHAKANDEPPRGTFADEFASAVAAYTGDGLEEAPHDGRRQRACRRRRHNLPPRLRRGPMLRRRSQRPVRRCSRASTEAAVVVAVGAAAAATDQAAPRRPHMEGAGSRALACRQSRRGHPLPIPRHWASAAATTPRRSGGHPRARRAMARPGSTQSLATESARHPRHLVACDAGGGQTRYEKDNAVRCINKRFTVVRRSVVEIAV